MLALVVGRICKKRMKEEIYIKKYIIPAEWATRCMSNESQFSLWQNREILIFSKAFRLTATLPTSYLKVIGSPVSGVKRQTLEDGHSHYPVLKLRMSGALLPLPHIHSWLSV